MSTTDYITSDRDNEPSCAEESLKTADIGLQMEIPKETYDAFAACEKKNMSLADVHSPREWTAELCETTDKSMRTNELIAGKSKSITSRNTGYEEKFNTLTTDESDTQSYTFTEEEFSEITYDSNHQHHQNERTDKTKINYRVRSNSVSDEKFDLSSATEGLRMYCNKLQAEKKESKERERAATVRRLGRDPCLVQRYEELYNIGKSRLISERVNSKMPEKKIDKRANSQSPSARKVMDRLYGRSISMQSVGRGRREEISKMRALSNTRSPINMSVSPLPHSLPKSSSTLSYRSSSPSPQTVVDRLYGRATNIKELGRERRDEVNKIRAQSNPRKPPRANRSSLPYNSSSQALADRLYSRSYQMQKLGRERRDELDEKRS